MDDGLMWMLSMELLTYLVFLIMIVIIAFIFGIFFTIGKKTANSKFGTKSDK